jgi:PBP1b-binding outer membrane lipoprotein LpoB
MRKRHIFPSLILLAVFLAACSPAATHSPAPSATPVILEPTATPAVDLTATPVYLDNLSSTPPPTLQAIATSRGPNLEATDPTTVRMDSGGLQFVEFFEFW